MSEYAGRVALFLPGVSEDIKGVWGPLTSPWAYRDRARDANRLIVLTIQNTELSLDQMRARAGNTCSATTARSRVVF